MWSLPLTSRMTTLPNGEAFHVCTNKLFLSKSLQSRLCIGSMLQSVNKGRSGIVVVPVLVAVSYARLEWRSLVCFGRVP